MKYQTFNSSCCYTGLANMLDFFSIDVEDRDIAGEINLPYILRFDGESNSFLAGPMLQGAEWFDLYLNPLGLRFAERTMSAEAAVSFLASADSRVMLGVELSDSGRNALVFDGLRGSRFHFINTKWKDSDGAEWFMFTASELYERLAVETALGWIERSTKTMPDFPEILTASLSYIPKYRSALHNFCSSERDRITLQWAMDPLFRPLVLDIPTMMELSGEARMLLMCRVIQRSLMNALQSDQEKLMPFDFISEQQLDEALDRYTEIIQTRIRVLLREQS